MGVLHKMLALIYIENGKGCRAGEMVSAEGGAELSVDGLELWRYQHTAHREAAAYTLGNGYEVGADAQPLMSEELTATAISTLYLVADEECTMLLAGSMKGLSKLWSNHVATAYALYGFYDAGAHVALGKFLLPCLDIVDGQLGYMAIGVDGRDNLGIVRSLYGE